MKDYSKRLTFTNIDTYTGRQGYAYGMKVFIDGEYAGYMEDKADGGMPHFRSYGDEREAGEKAVAFAKTCIEQSDLDEYGYDVTDEALSIICSQEADKHDNAVGA